MHANKNKTKVRTKLVNAQVKMVVLRNKYVIYVFKIKIHNQLLREIKST